MRHVYVAGRCVGPFSLSLQLLPLGINVCQVNIIIAWLICLVHGTTSIRTFQCLLYPAVETFSTFKNPLLIPTAQHQLGLHLPSTSLRSNSTDRTSIDVLLFNLAPRSSCPCNIPFIPKAAAATGHSSADHDTFPFIALAYGSLEVHFHIKSWLV